MPELPPGRHQARRQSADHARSALGRPAIIEVDVNYLLRVPLWDPTPRDSREFLGDRAKRFNLLDPHELAAGKLAALPGYSAARSGEVLSLTQALPWWHFRQPKAADASR